LQDGSGFLNLEAENFLGMSGAGASIAAGTPGGEVMTGSRRALGTTASKAAPLRDRATPECWTVLGLALLCDVVASADISRSRACGCGKVPKFVPTNAKVENDRSR
jgi:hypothetical protein